MIYDAHSWIGSHDRWKNYGPERLDAESLIRMMDDAGVQGSLVAPPFTGVAEHFKPDMERIAEAIATYPGRFFGLCRVKPRRGQAALDDMRYWVEERGFHGIKMNTIDEGYKLTERKLMDPVMELADELGIVVFFHTGDYYGASCTPEMVTDIALDFPRTTFVIGHMGYPSWDEGLVPAMKRAPNTVTTTGGVYHIQNIQDAVDGVGAERVLMGSHLPSWPPVIMMVMLIRDYMPQLSEVQKKAILGGNFERIFGLKE